MPCEFGIINQSEALIPYEIELNIWVSDKDTILKKHQRCEGSQSCHQLVILWWQKKNRSSEQWSNVHTTKSPSFSGKVQGLDKYICSPQIVGYSLVNSENFFPNWRSSSVAAFYEKMLEDIKPLKQNFKYQQEEIKHKLSYFFILKNSTLY